MSTTVPKPFGDNASAGDRKFPGRAVNNDVDFAETRAGRKQRFLDLFEVAHVSNNRESLAHVWIRSASIVDGLGCRLEVLELTTNQRNISARFSQRARHAARDARAAAGNEGDMTA